MIYNYITKIFVKKKKKSLIGSLGLSVDMFFVLENRQKRLFLPFTLLCNHLETNFLKRKVQKPHVVQGTSSWNVKHVLCFLIKQRLFMGQLFFIYFFSIFYFLSGNSANQVTKCLGFLSWLFVECCWIAYISAYVLFTLSHVFS